MRLRYKLLKDMPLHYKGAVFQKVDGEDIYECINGRENWQIPAHLVEDEDFFKKIQECKHDFICTKCGEEK